MKSSEIYIRAICMVPRLSSRKRARYRAASMRPSSLFRTFSLRIPASFWLSSPVAPFPLPSAFHRWLRTELAALRRSTTNPHQSPSYTSAAWISQALDVAIASQKITAESVARACGRTREAAVDDASLEDIVELLDACNGLRERMDAVSKYVESMRVAAHCLSAGGGGPNEATLARAEAALGAWEAMERRRAELDKCRSNLRKLGEKLAQDKEDADANELDEALSGSKAVALLACGVLSTALSFKSKRGLPTAAQCRGGSRLLHELHREVKEEMEKQRKNGGLVLDELREVVEAAQKLRGLVSRRPENEMGKREIRAAVGELERSCGELDDGIKAFEAKLSELYREMISIRVALLGLVSA